MKIKVLFLLAMSCLFVANAQNPSWNSSVSTILTDNIASEKFQQKIKVYKENIAFALTKECNSKYYIEELVDTQVSSNKVAIGVDSIFDMAILNEHIYFVGENNSVGFIGRVFIPHLQSGSGDYEITPTSTYKIRTIKTYNDSNGKQHVVGIGGSGSNHSLFFDFNDVNTPNFELKVIQINNQKALYDLDVTDKFIAVVGIQYGSSFNLDQSLIRIERDNTSIAQGYLFDHTINATRIMPDSYHEKMFVRHALHDKVVIMMNAYDANNQFVTLLNCVDLHTPSYIYNVQAICHDEKDMKIRDAIFDKGSNQMYIVEDCTVKNTATPRHLSYIMHAAPYLQMTYIVRNFYDVNNLTYFNCIDDLHTGRYIVAGVGTNCTDTYFAVKDDSQQTGPCLDDFAYKAVILNPLTCISQVSTSFVQLVNPTWNTYQVPVQNQINVICH